LEQPLKNYIWPIYYRPDTLDLILLPTKTKNYFKKIIEEKNIPNMLFHSVNPGTGKSSLAKIIPKEVKFESIYINTSLERGLDTLKEDIEQFATSLTGTGGMKICILDEFDGATGTLQRALRPAMEDFVPFCRFILTCNALSKVIDPIKSRCELIDFNFQEDTVKTEMKKKIKNRLINILTAEKIKHDPEVLSKLIDIHYPDIRYMTKLLQQYSTMYGIINDDIFIFKKAEEELFDLILKKQITAARQYILDKSYSYDELYRSMFDVLVPKLDTKNKQAQAILIIDEYMRGSEISFDKEITFTACMLRLVEIL
jgi:replication factor C small subunit